MKLNHAQLGKHLQGALAPVYVPSGDEHLLCQEAADSIRASARAQGFSERRVFDVDKSFDWGLLYQAGASLSLFAEKRVIELRINSGKPGDQGASALLEYLSRPPEDTLLLISLPKLDGSTQKTKWAKALIDNPASQFVQIWPVESRAIAAVDSPAPGPGRPQRPARKPCSVTSSFRAFANDAKSKAGILATGKASVRHGDIAHHKFTVYSFEHWHGVRVRIELLRQSSSGIDAQ